MKVLIAFGSKLGGTEQIATEIRDALVARGLEAEAGAARRVATLWGFDAVIVGGGIYAGRWHRDARRFVTRHARELRQVPVWMFSSGPLDESAATKEIPPVRQVVALMALVGARGHMTFGGRLAPDATGLVARALAKRFAGDWHDPVRVAQWATAVASELERAPRVEHG